jgi:MFS family permease
MSAEAERIATPEAVPAKTLRTVIFASSLGTLFEWYDFYLYGSLAAVFSTLFYPKGNETTAWLSTLATFGAGFVVRPFGALVFGRLGDVIGRKHTFLITMVIMGLSTAVIGLLPTFTTIGYAAPIILLLLRLAQGLALGGEYGGAATYVAEHAPNDKRGYYTSFIQTTATLGFFVSLLVILATRTSMSKEAFETWGWRVPFLASFVLLGVSVYIRLSLHESPVFQRLKASGKTAKNPLKESFGNPVNLRYVLIALFGAAAGQGVVWYAGQFYALFFLNKTLKVDLVTSYLLIAGALLVTTPLFIVFGRLSDKVGRKPIMLTGMVLAALTYYPLFRGLQHFANPELAPQATHVQVVPIVGILAILMVYVTMVYGPIAAFLVELFPTKIRYTSMSLPYHIGNGVFGGMLPLISESLTAKTGNMYMGLAYPIVIAILTAIIGAITIKETKDHHLIEDAAL